MSVSLWIMTYSVVICEIRRRSSLPPQTISLHLQTDRFVRHVAAGFTNTGQHFFKDPVLKLLCGGELAVDDKAIQISFCNVGKALNTTGGLGVVFWCC